MGYYNVAPKNVVNGLCDFLFVSKLLNVIVIIILWYLNERFMFLINVHFHDFMHNAILSTSVCTNSIHFVIAKGVGERWEGSWKRVFILKTFKKCWTMSSIDSRAFINVFYVFYFKIL